MVKQILLYHHKERNLILVRMVKAIRSLSLTKRYTQNIKSPLNRKQRWE